jgi:hypothetical protein
LSLVDAPMALIDRILARRAPPVQADDPIARMIARTTGRVRPGRSYQRRLRGRVVNQFVAMQEGLVPAPPRYSHSGRIGRSVLYASVGVALSVGAVGATSTSSLPGDPLYAVKRQIEQIRMGIAPASVKPDLAEMALEERLSEVEQLAQVGRWDRVAAAAPQVAAAEVTLRLFGRSLAPSEIASLARHRGILVQLLSAAPPGAAKGLQQVLASSDFSALADSGNGGQGGASAANGGNGRDDANTSSAKNGAQPSPMPSAKPHPSPNAGQGGQVVSTPSPTPVPVEPSTPRPTHSAHPSPESNQQDHD